ncbi:MAG: selenide, water dikinase SelD [Lewinella sp.]|nr:selenide, water dikinase SelD [Lewinella sp.]
MPQITPLEFPLTQYSHGAGCGCKISPKVLDGILASQAGLQLHPGLLVGNEERDDAAVMDLGDGTAIISTTDFFMPIVDDPFDFGRIAAVNAISDVYAMGGTPLLAIAILGWPVNTIPPEVANQVIEGGRSACADAGIPLAGGHSIDSPEPIFGLAVTGRVSIDQLKKNKGAQPGDLLYLTKPLGVGILSTAQKKAKLRPQDATMARDSMVVLNKIGGIFGELAYIRAMTDVTGFGLLGHLTEMCAASEVAAEIEFDKVPLLDQDVIHYYLDEKCIPGGTNRNWDSYGHRIGELSERQRHILCDPQTSGGLMVAVDPAHRTAFEAITLEQGLQLQPIGRITQKNDSDDVLVTVG